MTIRTHAKSVLSICLLSGSLTRPTMQPAQTREAMMLQPSLAVPPALMFGK